MNRNIVWLIGLTVVLATAFIIFNGCGSSGGGSSGSSVIPEAVGTIDDTFGISGVVTTTIGTNANAYDMKRQSDGKIVMVGRSSTTGVDSFALARYTITGALDTTFGTGGIVTNTIGTQSYLQSAAIQADGKIMTGGTANNGSTYDFALARYTITGTLDTTFGTGGVITTNVVQSSFIQSIAIQTDGKIVAGGRTQDGRFMLARYTITGTLDTSFGTAGITYTYIDNVAVLYGIALQTDGKIVAAGRAGDGSDEYFAIARYTTTGALDTTFSTDGVITTVIGTGATKEDDAHDIAIQSDGKIVVCGYSYNDNTGDYYNALVRYTSAGALDTTFGTNGVITTTIPTYTNIESYAIAIQSNGKILTAGYASDPVTQKFMLARYNTNGTLDTTFGGGDGIALETLGVSGYFHAIQIKPCGKILAGGSANSSFAVLLFK